MNFNWEMLQEERLYWNLVFETCCYIVADKAGNSLEHQHAGTGWVWLRGQQAKTESNSSSGQATCHPVLL